MLQIHMKNRVLVNHIRLLDINIKLYIHPGMCNAALLGKDMTLLFVLQTFYVTVQF